MKLLCVLAGAAVVLIAAVPVLAHHSFAAEFDVNKPVTIKGTVTKMEWQNPHTWIHIAAKDADGTIAEWAVEGGAPNALLRRGWTKNSVPVGVEIVVEGYQAKKDGTFRANGRDITFPDGKRLFIGSQGAGAPEEKTGRGRGGR